MKFQHDINGFTKENTKGKFTLEQLTRMNYEVDEILIEWENMDYGSEIESENIKNAELIVLEKWIEANKKNKF